MHSFSLYLFDSSLQPIIASTHRNLPTNAIIFLIQCFYYVIGLGVVEMDKFKILVLRVLLDKKKNLANVYDKIVKIIAKTELSLYLLYCYLFLM